MMVLFYNIARNARTRRTSNRIFTSLQHLDQPRHHDNYDYAMPPVQPREKDVYDIDSDQDDTDKTRSAAVMAHTLDRVTLS